MNFVIPPTVLLGHMGNVLRSEDDGAVRVKIITGPQTGREKIYHESDLMQVEAGTQPIVAAEYVGRDSRLEVVHRLSPASSCHARERPITLTLSSTLPTPNPHPSTPALRTSNAPTPRYRTLSPTANPPRLHTHPSLHVMQSCNACRPQSAAGSFP